MLGLARCVSREHAFAELSLAETEMPPRRLNLAASLMLFATLANADAPSGEVPRGQLLYETHCIACHSAEVHWRDAKLATDWPSLQSAVRRWQDVSGLAWSDRDIVEVARYLNRVHYHYGVPESRAGLDRRY
jgi:mono/diheme cytochrome c family protein